MLPDFTPTIPAYAELLWIMPALFFAVSVFLRLYKPALDPELPAEDALIEQQAVRAGLRPLSRILLAGALLNAAILIALRWMV